MTVERIMPAAAAALLLAWLERRGAIVALIDGDFVRVDLNPIPITDFGTMTPEVLAQGVLALRDEIRQILIARRTVH